MNGQKLPEMPSQLDCLRLRTNTTLMLRHEGLLGGSSKPNQISATDPNVTEKNLLQDQSLDPIPKPEAGEA